MTVDTTDKCGLWEMQRLEEKTTLSPSHEPPRISETRRPFHIPSASLRQQQTGLAQAHACTGLRAIVLHRCCVFTKCRPSTSRRIRTDCIAAPAVAVPGSPICRMSEVGLYNNPQEASTLDFRPQSASRPKLHTPLGLHKALVQNDETRGV